MSDLEQTQAIFLDEFDDETDDESCGKDKNPVAHLKVDCQKGFPERLFPIYEGDNVIGRQEDVCNVYIPLKALSREHACIEVRGDSHLLYDKGSRNKTRRGKLFLSPNVRYELKNDDEVTFGDVSCVYLIGDQDLKNDSGSETGSESMFETVPTDQVIGEPSKPPVESTLVYDNAEEEEYASDASSDILQPTQAYGAPTPQKQKLKVNGQAKKKEATLLFAPDSDHDGSPVIRNHKKGNITVQDTPGPSTSRQQLADLSTLVLPESGSDTDEEEVDTSTEADAHKVSRVPADLLYAATQPACVMESETDEDSEDEDDVPATKAHDLFTAATQKFDDVPVSEDEEDVLDAPTQAFVDESDLDKSRSPREKSRKPGRQQRKPGGDPTQAYDMVTSVEPTVAYDLEPQSKAATKKKSRSPVRQQRKAGCDPTLAYDLVTPVEPTVAYDLENETTQTFETSPSKHDKDEGKPEVEGKKESEEEEDEEDEEIYEVEEEEEEEENKEDMSHLFMNPTLACDMDPYVSDEDETEDPQPDADGPTQVFDATQPVEGDTSGSKDQSATQVFDDVPKASKPKKQIGKRSQPAEVGFDDATQAVDDVTTQAEDDATQVFDETASSQKGRKGRQRGKRSATKMRPPSDETAPISEDATLPAADVDETDNAAETLQVDAGRRTSGRHSLSSPARTPKQKVKTEDTDATQVFEDETQVFGETMPADTGGGKRGRKSAGKKIILPAPGQTAPVDEDVTPEIENMSDDATVPAFDTATLAVEDVESAPSKPKGRPSKGKKAAAVKPVMDETVPMTEDATQIFEEDAPTLAAADVEETAPKRRGRPRSKAKKDDMEPEATTQAPFNTEMATLVVTEEEYLEAKLPHKGRGRKGRSSAAIQPNNTTEDATQVFEADDIDGATLAVSDLEATKPSPVRKGHKGKQPMEEATQIYGADSDTEMDATLHVSELQTSPSGDKPDTSPFKGRKEKQLPVGGKDKAEEKATLVVTEEEYLEAKIPHKGRGRKGRSSAAPQLNIAEDATQVFEAGDIDGATLAVSDLGATKPSPVRKGRKGKQPIEEATQVYGADSDTEMDATLPVSELQEDNSKALEEAETQAYGADDESYDSPTPEIEEVLAQASVLEEVPLVRIPSRSPFKPAIASPQKKSRSPSPKKVTFATDESSMDSLSTNQSETAEDASKPVEVEKDLRPARRGRKSLQADDKIDQTKAPLKKAEKGKPGRKSLPASSGKAAETEKASPKRGRKSLPAIAEKESTESKAEQEEPSTARQRRGRPKEKSEESASSRTESEKAEVPAAPTRGGRSKGRAKKEEITQAAEGDKTEEEEPITVRQGRGRQKEKNEESASSQIEIEKPEVPAAPSRGGKSKGRGNKEEITEAEDKTKTLSAVVSKVGRRKGRAAQEADDSIDTAEGAETAEPAEARTGRGKGRAQKESKEVDETDKEKPASARGGKRKGRNEKEEEVVVVVAEKEQTEPSTSRGGRSKGRAGRKGGEEQSEDIPVAEGSTGGKEKNTGEKSVEETSNTLPSGGRGGRNKQKKTVKDVQNTEKCDKLDSDSDLPVFELTAKTKTKSGVNISEDSEESETLDKAAVKRRGRPKKIENVETDVKSEVSDSSQSSRATRKRVAEVEHVASESPTSSGKKSKQESKPAGNETGPRQSAAKRKGSQDSEVDQSPTKHPKSKGPGTPKAAQNKLKPADTVGSPSLRRKSMEPKPKVLFTGVVDEIGQKIVKDLGGSLVNSVNDCTHLVTDKVRRTVKFLCCLSRGIPIATPSWLESCKQAGMFLDPVPFLVADPATEKQYKFSLHRSLDKASNTSLLNGYRVHVTKSVKPDPEQMKDIIQSAGAEFLKTMPKTFEENTVVISCDDDKPLCDSALQMDIPVVTAEFLLTGILRQEADLNSYRIFVGTGKKRPSTSDSGAAAKRKRR